MGFARVPDLILRHPYRSSLFFPPFPSNLPRYRPITKSLHSIDFNHSTVHKPRRLNGVGDLLRSWFGIMVVDGLVRQGDACGGAGQGRARSNQRVVRMSALPNQRHLSAILAFRPLQHSFSADASSFSRVLRRSVTVMVHFWCSYALFSLFRQI